MTGLRTYISGVALGVLIAGLAAPHVAQMPTPAAVMFGLLALPGLLTACGLASEGKADG